MRKLSLRIGQHSAQQVCPANGILRRNCPVDRLPKISKVLSESQDRKSQFSIFYILFNFIRGQQLTAATVGLKYFWGNILLIFHRSGSICGYYTALMKRGSYTYSITNIFVIPIYLIKHWSSMVEIGLEINFCYIKGAIALGLIGNILKNKKKNIYQFGALTMV